MVFSIQALGSSALSLSMRAACRLCTLRLLILKYICWTWQMQLCDIAIHGLVAQTEHDAV
jgi:hypothetical protein